MVDGATASSRVLRLFCGCATVVLLLCYGCSAVVIRLFCCCATVVLRLCYVCSAAVLRLFCCCATFVLRLPHDVGPCTVRRRARCRPWRVVLARYIARAGKGGGGGGGEPCEACCDVPALGPPPALLGPDLLRGARPVLRQLVHRSKAVVEPAAVMPVEMRHLAEAAPGVNRVPCRGRRIKTNVS